MFLKLAIAICVEKPSVLMSRYRGSIVQQWPCVMVDGDRYCVLLPDAVDDGFVFPKSSCPWRGCCSPSTTRLASRPHLWARS